MRSDDELTNSHAMKREVIWQWRLAMKEEAAFSENMNRWDVLHRPFNAHFLHFKFVLNGRSDVFGNVLRHKASFVMRCDGEDEIEKIPFPRSRLYGS